jgi:hypothetical protein
MNILFTFDYEVFFGKITGNIHNCLLKPTGLLNGIAKDFNVKFTFFVDAGFLLKLKEYSKKYFKLLCDYDKIRYQLGDLVKNGHSLQLHIHSHWENSTFDGENWDLDYSHYNLQSFSQDEIFEIVKKYKNELEEISDREVFALRAGGWCIQPFGVIKDALLKNNIRIDSSVINNSCSGNFNFRNSPHKTFWLFNSEPNEEEQSGSFLEVPISSIRATQSFYWKLLLKKIVKTKNDNSMGNGVPLNPSNQTILRWLLLGNYSSVSVDGFKSSLLIQAFENYKNSFSHEDFFTIIGHPKSLTEYSIAKIKEFISFTCPANNFILFNIFKEKSFSDLD